MLFYMSRLIMKQREIPVKVLSRYIKMFECLFVFDATLI